jgi:hypothetical protein
LEVLRDALKEGDEGALLGAGFVSEAFEQDHDRLARKIGATECVDDEPTGPEPTLTIPSFLETLSLAEKKWLGERLEDELAAARGRKRSLIEQNRRVLDSLPRFPGSRLVSERQNPEDSDIPIQEEGKNEVLRYARATLDFDHYRILTTDAWGTFRTYSVPRGTQPREVHEFFLERLRGKWTLGRNEQSDGVAGEIFDLSFARGSACVWFHIGTRMELPPGRAFEVATDRQGRETFCRV